MGLLNGQTIDQTDFPATSAGAASSGKSVKLNAQGQLDPSFLGTKARVRAYKSGASQAISNTLVKILFESESFDTGNNFSSSTFTVPSAAYYHIAASLDGTSGSSSSRGITLAIYKNGTLYSSTTSQMTANSGVAAGANISDTLLLAASDTIEIYAVLSSADTFTALTGERYTFVTIIEL